MVTDGASVSCYRPSIQSYKPVMYPLQFCHSFEFKYFWFPQFVEFSTVFNVFLITSTLGESNYAPMWAFDGLTENALQDMKLQDKISMILSTQEAQKRAWPHGTSATPSRCLSRHTSQQLSTAAAGVAADVEVVPVAAAGDAVAGRLCHLRRW